MEYFCSCPGDMRERYLIDKIRAMVKVEIIQEEEKESLSIGLINT